jgi:hypothetical protein
MAREAETLTFSSFRTDLYEAQRKTTRPINPLTPITATSVHSHHCLSRAPEAKALIPKMSTMVTQVLNEVLDGNFEGRTVSTEVTPESGLRNVGNRCYSGRAIAPLNER